MGEYDLDFVGFFEDPDSPKYVVKNTPLFKEICSKILTPYFEKTRENKEGKGVSLPLRLNEAFVNLPQMLKVFRALEIQLNYTSLNYRPPLSKQKLDSIKKKYDKKGWELPSNPEYSFNYMYHGYYSNPPLMEIKRWNGSEPEPEVYQKEYKGAFTEKGWYIEFVEKFIEREKEDGVIELTLGAPQHLSIFYIFDIEELGTGEHLERGKYGSWIRAIELHIDLVTFKDAKIADYGIDFHEFLDVGPRNIGADQLYTTLIKIDPKRIIDWNNRVTPFAINQQKTPFK
jgi:hypothetical protein